LSNFDIKKNIDSFVDTELVGKVTVCAIVAVIVVPVVSNVDNSVVELLPFISI
jgi:hypothetical protein